MALKPPETRQSSSLGSKSCCRGSGLSESIKKTRFESTWTVLEALNDVKGKRCLMWSLEKLERS